MATGDRLDITARLKGALPRWFGYSHPVLDTLLGGLATAWANLYALLGYARQQARIQTASGAWLDLAAYDFFGNALARNANEEDGPFRARIVAGLLNEKCTRNAVSRVLATLTGRAPHIVEPLRPADTCAYGGTEPLTMVGTPVIYKTDWQGRQLQYATGRTNYIPYSTYAPVLWHDPAVSGITFTYGVPAPDGSNNAVRCDFSTATGTNKIVRLANFNLPAGTYVGSFWVRLVSGAPGALGADVTDYAPTGEHWYTPNGTWMRVTGVPFVTTGTSAAFFDLVNNTNASFVIDLFGAQIEPGTVSGGYMPTVGVPITTTDYTLTPSGLVTFAVPPAKDSLIDWSGSGYSAQLGQNIVVSQQAFGVGSGVDYAFQIEHTYGAQYGYATSGAYGSLSVPNQAFILAYRQQGAGIPYVAGYGIPTGAYRTPSQSDYASIEAMQGTIRDADIYAVVESVRPLGTEVWVAISN